MSTKIRRDETSNFGHYDDAAREYVVTDPRTPTKWVNHIGTLDFGKFSSSTWQPALAVKLASYECPGGEGRRAAAERRKSRPGEATRAQRNSKRNRARSPSSFERHRQEVIKIALSVMPIVFAGVVWLCFTLNREVGEQRETVAGVLRDVGNIRDWTQRAEDRVERQISAHAATFESLRSKLDDVREPLSGAGRLPVGPVLQRDRLPVAEYTNARR